ncbi:MAG: ATP-grasp domain-containing protein [Nitrospinae bacterium]|nr:ATP-grasp domain-containing protein [Nitrospinota bacterium]
MHKIVVTGVGAIIGYGIIKSLRQSRNKVHITGIDANPDAVGKVWCDSFKVCPMAKSDEFIPFMLDLIKKENVSFVIPGIPQDVEAFSKATINKKTNIPIVLNTKELIELSLDKWRLYKKLDAEGFEIIKTFIDGDFETIAEELTLPFLLKPRCSYASKGIVVIETEKDFIYWQEKMGRNFMVQEIIGSDEEEFTASAFGYGDGTSCKPIILRRKLSNQGSTDFAEVVFHQDIENAIKRLTELFRPVGPTNFQFRLHQGKPLLLEINPRISSATSIRTLFGFNEAEMSVQYYLEKKRDFTLELKSGTVQRFIEDYRVSS